MSMHISNLITNPETGRISHSKLWANIACFVATVMFIHQGFTCGLSGEIWLIYLGCVGGYSAARRWLATKDSSSKTGVDNDK